MNKIFTLILISFAGIVQAQSITAEEKRIADYIHKTMPQTMDLLKNLVNINSGSRNTPGIRKTGELLKKEFQKIGFQTEWVSLPDSLKNAGHLVAYRKGPKGKKLLLIGHLDTVFEPDVPANPFSILNDTTATGQGINDMKG